MIGLENKSLYKIKDLNLMEIKLNKVKNRDDQRNLCMVAILC